MGKGIVKLGEGQWAVKDGNLLAAKETNGRFKNAEFTVTRGSDATYVGRDGLIKNTSSNIESEVFINPTFDTTISLGSAGSGWSHSGDGEVAFYNGGLIMTGEGVDAAKARARDASLSSAILETSRIYELTYEIKSISSKSNTFSLYVAGNTITITNKDVGTHTILIASGTNANKIFQFQWTQSDNESIVLGDVSLKESLVTNGSFDTNSGWSYSTAAGWDIIDGKLKGTNVSAASTTQGGYTFLNKSFKVVYTVSDYVQGYVRIYLGGTQHTPQRGANGTYTEYITLTTANTTLYIQGINNFTGSVDNVSIFEIDNGALPRIDFTDNIDGHLLLEPQSTNLLTYSEDFDDSSWLKFATNLTITPNAIISPTGQTDASKLVSGSTNAQQAIYRNIIQSNCTLSVFAKKGEFDTIALKLSGSQVSKFDLSDGTIGYNTNVTPSIESVGNGWYRCSITIDSGSSAYAWIAIDTGNTQGDESSGIYIWGAQVEALPYATSHIPTNGSTVTRDGEIVQRESIDEIDIPQEEGTIYLELKGYEKNTEIFNLNRSTSNSIHVFTNSAGALRVIGYYEPEGTGTGVNATLDNNTSKVAIAFKNGSFIVYADGEEELNTSTFVWTPTTSIDRLYFNRGGYVASQGLSKVKALRIYKEAFNTTQLDELTS